MVRILPLVGLPLAAYTGIPLRYHGEGCAQRNHSGDMSGAHEENLGPDGHDLWNRVIKRNAYDNMRKLKLPKSSVVENWQ